MTQPSHPRRDFDNYSLASCHKEVTFDATLPALSVSATLKNGIGAISRAKTCWPSFKGKKLISMSGFVVLGTSVEEIVGIGEATITF